MKNKTALNIVVYHQGEEIYRGDFDEFPITIGRSTNAHICLEKFTFISGRHASIDFKDGIFIYKDHESSNGSKINGEKIQEFKFTGSTEISIGKLRLALLPTVNESTASALDPTMVNTIIDETMDFKISEDTVSAVVESNQIQPESAVKKSVEKSPKKEKISEPTASRAVVESFAESAEEQPSEKEFDEKTSFTLIHKIIPGNRALKSTLTWKGVVIDEHIHRRNEVLFLSGTPEEGIYVPSLKGEYPMAQFQGKKTRCVIPSNAIGRLINHSTRKVTKLQDLFDDYSKTSRLSFTENEELEVNLGDNLILNLMHVEAPKPLSEVNFLIPKAFLQMTIGLSALLHVAFVVIGLVLLPAEDAPKIKNVPPRIAKLLVQKPKPKKKVEKPKPPEKKKVVKKVPPKKKPKKIVKKKIRKVKPKKVVIKHNKKIKKLNKYPFTVKTKNISKAPVKGTVSKKKNVKKLGALAALGALGASKPVISDKPVAININKNAGGRPGKFNPNAVIGAIKSKNGKLVAGGSGSLKTKGKGFGTGTGYGVQGIKGSAGARGVAAAVYGNPKLLKISRQEGLSNKQVMDVVKKYAGKISSCYERALLSNPDLSGRIEYEWKISPRGKVKWAKVKKSDVSRADELNTCVKGVFVKMKFPKAKNGQTTLPSIGFPFGRF